MSISYSNRSSILHKLFTKKKKKKILHKHTILLLVGRFTCINIMKNLKLELHPSLFCQNQPSRGNKMQQAYRFLLLLHFASTFSISFFPNANNVFTAAWAMGTASLPFQCLMFSPVFKQINDTWHLQNLMVRYKATSQHHYFYFTNTLQQ